MSEAPVRREADGTARRRRSDGERSRNAILNEAARLATVEGVGVPVAIGATGVLLFALRALSAPVSVIVAVTVAVCVEPPAVTPAVGIFSSAAFSTM